MKRNLILGLALVLPAFLGACGQKQEEEVEKSSRWSSSPWNRLPKDGAEVARQMKELNESIRLNPEDHEARKLRADRYMFLGRFDEAINDYSEAIKQQPGLEILWINRGTAHDRKDDFDQAIKDYSEAIKLKAEQGMAWASRGTAYANKGQFKQAAKDLDKAISLEPGNAAIWGYRVNFQILKGDHAQAVKDLTEAIRLEPYDEKFYLLRSKSYREIGDKDKAQDDSSRWAKFRALNLIESLNPGGRARGLELEKQFGVLTSQFKNVGKLIAEGADEAASYEDLLSKAKKWKMDWDNYLKPYMSLPRKVDDGVIELYVASRVPSYMELNFDIMQKKYQAYKKIEKGLSEEEPAEQDAPEEEQDAPEENQDAAKEE